MLGTNRVFVLCPRAAFCSLDSSLARHFGHCAIHLTKLRSVSVFEGAQLCSCSSNCDLLFILKNARNSRKRKFVLVCHLQIEARNGRKRREATRGEESKPTTRTLHLAEEKVLKLFHSHSARVLIFILTVALYLHLGRRPLALLLVVAGLLLVRGQGGRETKQVQS